MFARLVSQLATEGRQRQLSVVSRASPAAFRVRGYIAAAAIRGRARFDWVWDVYDAERHRAVRLTGQEAAGAVRAGDVWAALDEPTLSRMARASMDQLVRSLGPPAVGAGPIGTAFAEETPR